MAYSGPYPHIVDGVIEGMQQGVDTLIPLELGLEDGDTDTAKLALATDDKVTAQVYQYNPNKERLEAQFEVESVRIIPEPPALELTIRGEDTLPLKMQEGKIDLYVTVFVEDAAGSSRPCSKIDLHIPLEPAFQ